MALDGEKAVLIRISRTYRPGMGDAELYERTRKWWVLNPRRDPDWAFAVHAGRVLAVYRIDDWEQDPQSGRWAFRGVRDDNMTHRYGGRDLSEHFPRGAANPIRYLNC